MKQESLKDYSVLKPYIPVLFWTLAILSVLIFASLLTNYLIRCCRQSYRDAQIRERRRYIQEPSSTQHNREPSDTSSLPAGQNQPDTEQTRNDLFQSLYDLSRLTTTPSPPTRPILRHHASPLEWHNPERQPRVRILEPAVSIPNLSSDYSQRDLDTPSPPLPPTLPTIPSFTSYKLEHNNTSLPIYRSPIGTPSSLPSTPVLAKRSTAPLLPQ